LEGVGESALELLNALASLQDETVPTILINDFVTQAGSVDQRLVLADEIPRLCQPPPALYQRIFEISE